MRALFARRGTGTIAVATGIDERRTEVVVEGRPLIK
jgi:hypothetical protein